MSGRYGEKNHMNFCSGVTVVVCAPFSGTTSWPSLSVTAGFSPRIPRLAQPDMTSATQTMPATTGARNEIRCQRDGNTAGVTRINDLNWMNKTPGVTGLPKNAYFGTPRQNAI